MNQSIERIIANEGNVNGSDVSSQSQTQSQIQDHHHHQFQVPPQPPQPSQPQQSQDPNQNHFQVESTSASHVNQSSPLNMLSPDLITWYYLDSFNNEQGPFTSQQMSNWFKDGYLNLELMIKYQNSSFMKLQKICELGSFSNPFDVSLPDPSTLNQSPLNQTPLNHSPLNPSTVNSTTVNPSISLNSSVNQDIQGSVGPISSQNTGMSNQNTGISNQNTGISNGIANNINNGGINLLNNLNQPYYDLNYYNNYPLMNNLNNNLSNLNNINGINGINPLNMGMNMNNLNMGMNNLTNNLGAMNLNNYSSLNSINPLSRTNSSWGVNSMDYSSPSTPLATANPLNPLNQPLNNLNGVNGTSTNHNNTNSNSNENVSNNAAPVQPTPISPWSNTNTPPISTSPFVASQSVLNSKPESIVDEKLGDIDLENVKSSSITVEEVKPNIEVEEIQQPNVIIGEIQQPRVVKAEEIQQPKIVKGDDIQVDKQEKQPKQDIKESIEQPKVTKPEASQPVKKEVKLVSQQPPAQAIEKLESKAPTAPWANLTKPSSTPKLSLKDIQKIENEKLQKQKKIENEIKSDFQTSLLQQEKQKEIDEASNKISLPASWGANNNKTNKPLKTLSEIQEEERRASEALKQKGKSSSLLTSSIAATISQSTPKDDGAWTTVVNKKPLKSSSLQSSASSFQTSSTPNKVTPQTLRSISANATTVENSLKPRIEFISWAKSQMTNLYPSVSTNDLLEMFISLPQSSDSNQLISETVYASSTTMNGRVFANDFLKKRQAVDKAYGNNLSEWSKAIIEAGDVVNVDEDGWSTSTKSKKKGRKN